MAMEEEINALTKNKTWEVVDRPANSRPIKNKWVFKVKLNPEGQIDRYKARLVAKGFTQIETIDYKETYAPVASMNTIRIFFAVANLRCMEIAQFDIKTAFLYGDLEEEIYMDYPDGYPNPENKVCRLTKSLYGLKQAPRNWNKKFDKFLQQFNLEQANIDKCLYFNNDRSLLLALYVDDGLIAAKDKKQLTSLIKYLQSNFEMKVMNCEAYLGFKIIRNTQKRELSLVQNHYVDKILERFSMQDCKPASTPGEVGVKIEESPLLPIENKFKELVGSLLYLVTCTRPDIAHAVSVASRTSQPTEAHWNALKRVLRYLKGTRDIGITFRWEEFPELVGYSDADYANDVETRRSTSGYCIMYGGGPIAWRCQRQPIVTLSTTEAEYVSGCEMVKELIPIREQLIELEEISPEKPAIVLIDNQSAVRIAKNEAGQQRTKHIDVREKWLTEQAYNKKIEIRHISGDRQAADILTKPLHKTKFTNNRNLLLTSVFAMLMLIGLTTSFELKGTSPLFFRPTDYQYFDGDIEFKMKTVFVNPCEELLASLSEPESINRKLVTDCYSSYENKIVKRLKSCKRLDDVGNNLTDIPAIAGCSPFNTNCELKRIRYRRGLSREKRFVPILAIGVYALIVGTSIASYTVARENAKNIDILKEAIDKERELFDTAGQILESLQKDIHSVYSPSEETALKLRDLEMQDSFRKYLAGFIERYESFFTEQSEVLGEIDAMKEKDKVPERVRYLANHTLWDEPASDWSTLYDCSWQMVNKSMVLNLHFNMPKRNDKLKIMEAIALNFYNASLTAAGEKQICWMKYRGPKHVLVNTTNNCMSEIIEFAIDRQSVRDQMCVNNDEKLKIDGSLWEPTTCYEKPHSTKRVIQDREVNGIHKIYCLTHNITIDGTEQPCPDHPFELEGRTSYRISNLEHHGAFKALTVYKEADLDINRDLMRQLHTDGLNIQAPNITGKLNLTRELIEKYKFQLSSIPEKLNITNPTIKKLLTGPLDLAADLWESCRGYLETFGIVLGSILGIVIFAMLLPVFELIFISLGMLRIPIRLWYRSFRRVVEKGKEALTLEKKKRRNKYKLMA